MAVFKSVIDMIGNTPMVDVTELSRSGAGRAGWIADDGLHPGDGQYEAWSHYIWQQVAERWTVQTAG